MYLKIHLRNLGTFKYFCMVTKKYIRCIKKFPYIFIKSVLQFLKFTTTINPKSILQTLKIEKYKFQPSLISFLQISVYFNQLFFRYKFLFWANPYIKLHIKLHIEELDFKFYEEYVHYSHQKEITNLSVSKYFFETSQS